MPGEWHGMTNSITTAPMITESTIETHQLTIDRHTVNRKQLWMLAKSCTKSSWYIWFLLVYPIIYRVSTILLVVQDFHQKERHLSTWPRPVPKSKSQKCTTITAKHWMTSANSRFIWLCQVECKHNKHNICIYIYIYKMGLIGLILEWGNDYNGI